MSSKFTIKEIVKIIPGMSFHSRDTVPDGRIPVINAAALRNLTTVSNFDNLPTINNLPTRSPAIAKDNDILLVSRATPGSGFKSVLLHTDIPVVATSSLYILRPNTKLVLPEYLNLLMNSDAIQNKIKSKARGATISHITKSMLANLEVHIPDKKTQETIIKIHTNITQQKKLYTEKQQLLEEIIQSTLSTVNT